MFDLPDTYRVDVNVVLKDFIPTDLKPNEKKRSLIVKVSQSLLISWKTMKMYYSLRN